jgi:hypothetical protein
LYIPLWNKLEHQLEILQVFVSYINMLRNLFAPLSGFLRMQLISTRTVVLFYKYVLLIVKVEMLNMFCKYSINSNNIIILQINVISLSNSKSTFVASE